jgi:hypothetical protein
MKKGEISKFWNAITKINNYKYYTPLEREIIPSQLWILTFHEDYNCIYIISGIYMEINVREHRRGNYKMDNPEKLATLGTQDEVQTKQK